MTTPITSTTSNPLATTPPMTSATSTDQLGKDTFLKLLVAQLKYQNPMNPTDGSEFLAQTAQFTMVEKLEDLVKQNTEMVTSERLSAAASFLGRRVAYNTPDGEAKVGIVSGFTIDPTDGPILRVGQDDVQLVMIRAVAADAAMPSAPITSPNDQATTPAADPSSATGA